MALNDRRNVRDEIPPELWFVIEEIEQDFNRRLKEQTDRDMGRVEPLEVPRSCRRW